MPLYEFQCTDCDERMELIVKVNSRPPKCPDCGGKLRKLVSAPAFQFKGSGWYVTDYAGKSKTSESSSKEGAKGGDAGESSSSSDSGSSKSSESSTKKSDKKKTSSK